MDRLDRYVAKVFLSSWVLSVVFFTGLLFVYRLFSSFDDLLGEAASEGQSLGDAGLFFLVQMPAMVLMVAPFIMVMAALVTMLRLKRHGEFLAMVLVGRPARRVLRPVFLLTAVFALLLVGVQEFVAPAVAETRDELHAQLIEKQEERVEPRVKVKDRQGGLFVASGFHVEAGSVDALSHSSSDAASRRVVVRGEDAVYDATREGWKLRGGGTRSVVLRAGQPASQEAVDFLATDVTPDDLRVGLLEPWDLAWIDLVDLCRRYPQSREYKLYLHYHVTYPLSILLLVLLSVPWMLDWVPSSRVKGLAAAIGLCLGFMFLDIMVRDFGSRGYLQPVLAAWLPPILAGSLAIVLFDTKDA